MTQRNGKTGIRQGLATLACLTALVGLVATRADAQTNAFVANTTANAVNVIQPDADGNLQVAATVQVGNQPTDVAIAQDGTHAYVANTGIPYSISKIDTNNPDPADTFINLVNQPISIAVDSRRNQLYVLEAGGVLEIFDATNGGFVTSIGVGGDDGQVALTPDGNYLYVAAGSVTVIDTVNNNAVVRVFTPEVTPTAGISNTAVGVAISPTAPLAYIAVVTFSFDFFGFHASGGLAAVNTDTIARGLDINPVEKAIPLFSLPRSVAFAGDGSVAYAGIQSFWADTLYGAGFLPGRWVASIDAKLNAVRTWIDLGADGTAWADQHTPAGVAVAPDRSAVFVSIPSNGSVVVIDPATDVLTGKSVTVAGNPNGVAVVPNAAATPKPFTLHATDDVAPNPLPAQHAGIAIANVLANDTIGGGQAALGNVTLSVASPTSPSLSLDTATGAVWTTADAAVGDHTLTYQICDAGNADVCATAAVHAVVRPRYPITTTEDLATSLPGVTAIANVLANDALGPDAASLATVALFTVSTDSALSLNPADGSVAVSAAAAKGDHLLTYRICELADPENCSPNATAAVTVIWRDIRAGNDSASASRDGGVAIANVLANDMLDGAAATLAGVTISTVSSTSPGVTLNESTGSVSVASGTALGPQSVVYRICERANSANCSDDATASVTVTASVVSAVADRARASSKTGGMAVVNVLANDRVGNAPATAANVTLSLVSLSPSNRQIRLNADGTVDVLGKSSGGTYSLRYQICELAAPTNCAQATLTLDLSGK